MIYQELVDLIREHNLQVKKVVLDEENITKYNIYDDKGDYIVEINVGGCYASLGASKEEIITDVINIIKEYFEVRNIDSYGKLITFLDKNSENNKAWVGE